MTPSHSHGCRGLFVVFEGLDGAGKTTQVRLLDERLRRAGYAVVCLKEPTDGPWGQQLRRLAQEGRQDVAPDTELEWFLADRREDVVHNIQPALARGQIVLLDRYYFSTIAYQGALGCDREAIRSRNEAFAPTPDCLFILDIAPELGLERVRQRGALSHFERLPYLQRVAPIFAAMAFPYATHIDASAAPETIQDQIWRVVASRLAETPVAQAPAAREETA